MRKFAVCMAVFTLVACSGKGPTGPDFPTGNGVAPGSVSETAVPQEPADTGLDIKITNSGNVLNGTDITYTACLYNAPYGAGNLVEEWRAKPGKTALSYEAEGCEPVIGQIDIIEADKCPASPHGLVLVAANTRVTIPAEGGEQCEECEPGEYEPTERPVLVEEGEWGECPLRASNDREYCSECRLNLYEQTFSNGCQQRTKKTEKWERRRVECEVECPFPEEEVLSWSGKGDPQTECEAFGDYDAIDWETEEEEVAFWICKAGNDREVWEIFPDGESCRNGKDISHVTACVCDD